MKKKKNYSKSFSDANNFSDIGEEIVKQINTLKPLYIEPRKTIPKKHFVWKEDNYWEEEINLTPQDRTGNIDWCKCRCEYKVMAIFAETFFLLLRLKSQSANGTSCYPDFTGNCLTISHVCYPYLPS